MVCLPITLCAAESGVVRQIVAMRVPNSWIFCILDPKVHHVIIIIIIIIMPKCQNGGPNTTRWNFHCKRN